MIVNYNDTDYNLANANWTQLADMATTGYYTVADMSKYHEILFVYGYLGIETQTTILLPIPLFTSARIYLKDNTNGTTCCVSKSANTSIQLMSNSNTSWRLKVFAR